MIVMVSEGVIYADTQWKLITDDPITIGTTALTFTQNYMANSIAGGSSNVTVFSNANVVISSAGTANVLTITSTGTVTTGTASVTGDIATGGIVSATGNITAGNLVTTGQANIGTLTVNGGSTFTGNLLPSANVTYNLGSPTQRWNEIFLAANTIDIGGATISADIETGSLILKGPDGAEFVLTGTSLTDSFGVFGIVEAGNTSPATSTTTGALRVAGGAGIAGNIYAGGIVDIAGNSIYLGNLVLKDNGSNVFGLYAADGVTPATISQTSVDTTKISNGTSNVQVVSVNANVTVSVGGTANVMVVSTTGANVLGTLGVTGNITGSNTSATNHTGTNVSVVGTVTAASTVGGVITGTSTSVTGTQTAASTVGGVITGSSTSVTGGVTAASVSGGTITGTSISVTGTQTAASTVGGVITGSSLSASGNVTGGNILTGGLISVTGNITGGNISAVNHAGTNVSVTGTVTAASTVGGIITGSSASVTGNVNGSNVVASTSLTNGNITITGANIVSTGTTLTIDPNGSGGTDGNVIITGNLSVQGNVTYINSNNVTTNDLTINMANNAATAAAANGGGIGVGPAGSEYISLTYNSTSNIWVATNGLSSQGILSATGNVTGGNLLTGAQVSAVGNIIGGNIATAGQVSAAGNVVGSTLIASGNVVVQSRQQVKFYDTDSSNFISLRAPNALAGDYLLTLPTSYGNADQVLSTNGAGILAWADQSGGGGGSSATSYPNSTVSPVPGSIGNFDLRFNFVQTSEEIPFETSATDAFGVNLGEVYSMMDPGGEVLEPVDLGVLT
jgi:hypothetical protein